jgi:hypothetical protein
MFTVPFTAVGPFKMSFALITNHLQCLQAIEYILRVTKGTSILLSASLVQWSQNTLQFNLTLIQHKI